MWDPFGFSLSSIATHFRGLMNMQWGWWWWWPLSPPVRPPFQPPILLPPHPLLSNLFDGSYWHSSLGRILSSLPHRFAIASCFPLVCPSASAFTLGNFDMQISPFDLLRNWINYDIIIKKKATDLAGWLHTIISFMRFVDSSFNFEQFDENKNP